MSKDLWDYVGLTAKDLVAGGGWVSSYTGKNFSKEEMEEYTRNAYLKLEAHLHKDLKVLEIGCSSGLTMFQLAPKVKMYHGTDLSSSIITNTQKTAREKGFTNINLSCLPAHDIDQLSESEFDLIIINSVIHCFEGYNYLRQVLVKAIEKLSVKGLIFLGDMLDEEKREEFIQDLVNYKQTQAEEASVVKTDWASELFVPKKYLVDLVADNIGIVEVDFSDKIHSISNELTRYRYDALLTINKASKAKKTKKSKLQFDLRTIVSKPKQALNLPITSDNLVYVLYTSGSTGKPKGCLLENKGLINRIDWMWNEYGYTDQDVILQKTTFTFDVSVWEIFMPLCWGAKMVVCHQDDIASPEKIMGLINEHQVTCLHFVPSMLNVFISALFDEDTIAEKLTSLTKVITSGEALSVETTEKWYKKLNTPIYNLYGPTEVSIDVTSYDTKKGDLKIPIGKPIWNTEIVILDSQQQVVPIGISGEIYIGGDGLARGYLNRPELTAERFVMHPFKKGQRLYRTGDKGKWWADGNVEFLGRKDHQVKIRGYRIELGEIESVLVNHEQIDEAIVLAHTNEQGENYLKAFIRSKSILVSDQIRAFLKLQVPEYMIPSQFVQVDTFPLNNSGKTDRKALLALEGSEIETGIEYSAPRSEQEVKMKELWEELLERKNIGIRDNFFKVGGHSLKVVQLVSRIYKLFNRKINLKEVFDHPTIASLCEILNAGRTELFEAIPVSSLQEAYPVSHSQKRLWVLSQFEGASAAYNMFAAFQIEGKLNTSVFEQSVIQSIERHEILRTVFLEREGELKQIILSPDAILFKMEMLDLSGVKDKKDQIERLGEEELRKEFDLKTAPLLRIKLVKMGKNQTLILFTIHHIISDGWSIRILFDEILKIYNANVNNGDMSLDKLRIQYKDYSAWQIRQLEEGILKEQENYWLNHLSGVLPSLVWPIGDNRPAAQTFNGSNILMKFDKKKTARIKTFAQQNEATLFATLLSFVYGILHKYTGQRDIIIGTPVAGRNHVDLEGQLGCYLNLLPLRITTAAESNFQQLVQVVKDSTQNAFDNQLYPFDLLVEKLKIERDLSRSPLFDVLIVLNNTKQREQSSGHMHELKVSPYNVKRTASQYDLSFNFEEINGELSFFLEYNTDIFDTKSMERFFIHFQNFIEDAISNPQANLNELEYLSPTEKKQLIALSGKNVKHISKRTVIDLFEEQVQKNPHQLAAVFNKETITFQELNEKSNQLANYLLQNGVQAETLVGISVSRSLEMLICLLGIWKSGAAYVPLDPNYPQERISFIVQDAQLSFILTEEIYQHNFSGYTGKLCCIDTDGEKIISASSKKTSPKLKQESLAYVIYTSGSTGTPKGVLIEHRQLTNFLYGMNEEIGCSESDSMLALTTISFDISILELFWPLINGAKVILLSDQLTSFSADESHVDEKTKDLEFSLFYFSSVSDADDERSQDKYKLLMEGAKYADQNGFKAVWTPERHFHEFGGIYPNPSVISAALAMVTKNIDIRAGSVVLPLHHPVRVAEEWSVVDNLSKGRVGISLASGWHSNDFILNKGNYLNRHSVMYEGIETLNKLWTGETISVPGFNEKMVDVRIYPLPVQKKLPMWITAAGSPDTFISAGKLGLNLLTHLLTQNIEELAEKIRLYRKSWKEAGHTGEGHVTLMIHTFVGTDGAEIKKIIEQPFKNYLKSSAELIRNLGKNFGSEGEKMTEKDMDALLEHAFERYYQTASLFGTPTTCLSILSTLSSCGVDELGCLIDFGVEEQTVLDHMKHLTALKENFKQRRSSAKQNISLQEQMSTYKPTLMQCTPSMAQLLISEQETSQALASLQKMLIGGEKLPVELAQMLTQKVSAKIFNMYGPTETTVWSSVYGLQGVETNVSIGQPILNTSIYILDNHQQLLPQGAQGEIFIGGKGVARGYLNRAELTEERFIKDPFSKNGKLYKTGDKGKWSEDGLLMYIGRYDDQLKIKGHRIEPGEIEYQLKKLNEVSDAVVVAGNSGTVLIAYIRSNEVINADALMEKLQGKLPEFMIPRMFIQIDQFPLTPNGKINRNALRKELGVVVEVGSDYEEAATDMEKKLLEVWQSLLGKEKIGVNDNFFALGGDSIRAIQMASRLKQKGLKVAIKDIFFNNTIRTLAKEVKEENRVISQGIVTGLVPLLPAQKWFFSAYKGGEAHYNHAFLLQFKQKANEQALEAVLQKIVNHHDALRMHFDVKNNGIVIQENAGENFPFFFEKVDLRKDKDADANMQLHAEQIQSGLSLKDGPLFKSVVYQQKENDYLLLVTHHLVIDGISWRILLEDLQKGYMQYLNEEEMVFPLKTDSFQNWSDNITDYRKTTVLKDQVNYWRKIENVTIKPIAKDNSAENKVKDSCIVSIELESKETTELLTKANDAYNTEINDLLLTALGMAMNQFQKNEKMVITLEGHGREEIIEEIDISRTIGWFTSMYPVVIDLLQEETIEFKIKRTKENLRSIPLKGIGYGILKYLADEPLAKQDLKPEILFNYLGQTDSDIKEESLFEFSGKSIGFNENPDSIRPFVFEINSIVAKGALRINITYSSKQFQKSTIDKLLLTYADALKEIIVHCTSKSNQDYTPSDFAFKDMRVENFDLEDLEDLINK